MLPFSLSLRHPVRLLASCMMLSFGTLHAQKSYPPIKVYLLATFDFNAYPKVFDPSDRYRQKEIAAFSQTLCNLQADKIFLPFPHSAFSAAKTDSMYRAFTYGDSTRHADACIQLGFRTAHRLQHTRVFCSGNTLDSTAWNLREKKLAADNGQSKWLSGKENGSRVSALKAYRQDSLLQALSLKEYLVYLNGKSRLTYSASRKFAIWPRLGKTHVFSQEPPDFAGTQMLADWYREGIMQYSHILNQLDFGEKTILIFTDTDHLIILKEVFEKNPSFQVIPTESWLGRTSVP